MNSGDRYKDEYWGELPGFSRYLISSYGRIMVKEHITCEDKRNRKRHFDSRLLKLTLTKDRDGSGDTITLDSKTIMVTLKHI